jgi:lysozyme
MATPAPFLVVDVGPSQGEPDWAAVAAAGRTAVGSRVDAVYLKATEGAAGAGSSVPTFGANAAGVVAAGLPLGCYHFLSPFSEPEAQADHFLATVGGCGHTLPPMVDLERSVGQAGQIPSVDCLLKFLSLVEAALGATPLIYTADWVAVPLGLGKYPELKRSCLWVSAFKLSDPQPFAPWGAWSDADGGVLGWQYTGSGVLPGFKTRVDLSRFKALPTWVVAPTTG